jgi:hypothetical protein
VFASVLRLFMASLSVVLMWNFGSHAVDNYRAMELGIPGTVAVQGCRPHCHGPFVSDDGQVRIGSVDLVSTGSDFQARPGHSIPARVASSRSTGAHVDRDWPSMTLLLVVFLLVIGFILMLLTPDRMGRRVTLSPATDAVMRGALGAAAGSRELTAYRWLLIGSILLAVGLFPVAGSFTVGLGATSTDRVSTVETVTGWALAGALLMLGTTLIGKGIAGIGRRLYLFERGLVVSRRGRHTVYRYAEVVDARVSRSRVRDDGPTYPYAIRLTLADGRRVTISDRGAVPTIMEHVHHHE